MVITINKIKEAILCKGLAVFWSFNLFIIFIDGTLPF